MLTMKDQETVSVIYLFVISATYTEIKHKQFKTSVNILNNHNQNLLHNLRSHDHATNKSKFSF